MSEGWSGAGVAASVAIFKADDVVFAEVGAGLYFDENDWRSAVVANSVFGVNRNFDCAARGHGVIDIVEGDDGSAFDNDPVFRPLVV